MGLELNITPEDVEQLVRDSIMKAGFGKAVEEACKKAFSGYDNPVEKEVKRYVAEVAAELVRAQFRDQVVAAVAAAIEAKVTPQLIDTVTAAAMDRVVRAAEDKY